MERTTKTTKTTTTTETTTTTSKEWMVTSIMMLTDRCRIDNTDFDVSQDLLE